MTTMTTPYDIATTAKDTDALYREAEKCATTSLMVNCVMQIQIRQHRRDTGHKIHLSDAEMRVESTKNTTF